MLVGGRKEGRPVGSKEHSLKTVGFIQPPPHLQMSARRFRPWGSGMLLASLTTPGGTAVPHGRGRGRAQAPESVHSPALCLPFKGGD